MNVLHEFQPLPDGFHEVLKATNRSLQGVHDPAYFTISTSDSPVWLDSQATLPWGRGAMVPTVGQSWLFKPASGELRLAVRADISPMVAIRKARRESFQLDGAKRLFDTDPQMRRILKPLMGIIVAEFNSHTAAFNGLRAEILAASSLADLKTRITNKTSDLPARTRRQFRKSIRNAVSGTD